MLTQMPSNVIVSWRSFFYENIPNQIHKNFTSENWKFSGKRKADIFHTSAQNIECEYSLEPPRQSNSKYPQSMFLSENKKNNVYPC